MSTSLTFHQALTHAEAQARRTLVPALHGRLSDAVELVEGGRVFQESDGTWQVDSPSTQGLTYSVNGVCNCHDAHFNKPPQGLCKHRLSVYLTRRAVQLMQPPAPDALDATESPPAPEAVKPRESTAVPEGPHGIDARHIIVIQGRPFVRFAGLLDLAHKRGLQALKVDWSFNDPELSLAHASAVFPFGTFDGSSPANFADAFEN